MIYSRFKRRIHSIQIGGLYLPSTSVPSAQSQVKPMSAHTVSKAK